MDGPWLVSYVALWLANLAFVIILIGVVRQIGVLHLKVATLSVRPAEGEGRALGEIAIGRMGPPFVGTDLVDGREISSEDLRGRRAVLVFVTPACGLCQELVPVINELIEKMPETQFLLISEGGRYRNKEFVNLFDVRAPLIPDVKGDIAHAYDVPGQPTVLVLDEMGKVRRKFMNATRDDLRLAVEFSPRESEDAVEAATAVTTAT